LTNDHLGSPRINTDQNGAVTTRHDYHPFGEEINGIGGRTTGLAYGDDPVRKQFTGYERDNETNLDYAKARMFGSSLGRFMSPDPQKIVVDVQLEKDPDRAQSLLDNYLSKPGQWNRYVYAINNPLRYTDPDGREIRLSKDLTEAERNQILYYLSRNTRDKLNWKTDKSGNIVITVTEVKGGGQNDGT
jgi:RHS repeat-associated protein